MTDPNEHSSRKPGSTRNGTVEGPESDKRPGSPHPKAGQILELERMGRRRLQKKFFISKGRRDVA